MWWLCVPPKKLKRESIAPRLDKIVSTCRLPGDSFVPAGAGHELHLRHRSCFCAIASLNRSRVLVFGLRCGREPRSTDQRLDLLLVRIFVLCEAQDLVAQ